MEELNRLNPEEYPEAALQMRDVFLSIAEHVTDELWTLHDAAQLYGIRGGDVGFTRMRRLVAVVHSLYSYLRYLLTSSPQHSPPGIQVALQQLSNYYFPAENGAPTFVVRPQWKYNLTYVGITWHLRDIISLAVLDPEGRLGAGSPDELLERLWVKYFDRSPNEHRLRLACPKQLAVLSFAGLDTDNALFYPLLAHELGHFIDYSFNPPKHLDERLRQCSRVTSEEVQRAVEEAAGRAEYVAILDLHEWLVGRLAICIRELLADQLAVRMMGLAFFVALAEFLKGLAIWPEPVLTASGYPGTRFRLSAIFAQLGRARPTRNVLTFLSKSRRNEARPLQLYMNQWRTKLARSRGGNGLPADTDAIRTRLNLLAESTLSRTLETLAEVAREIIPDDRCACLSEKFFNRVDRLVCEVPPVWEHEGPECFGEVMSAAWAYELIYGRHRENATGTLHGGQLEYTKTCRLLLKAIELSPVLQSPQPKCQK